MNQYRENMAAPRKSPTADKVWPAPALAKDSNQELTQGQSAKFRNVSTAPKPGVSVGNQVKVQGNTKGTGVAGRPSSIGDAARDSSKPAVVNPSGGRSQTTARYR